MPCLTVLAPCGELTRLTESRRDHPIHWPADPEEAWQLRKAGRTTRAGAGGSTATTSAGRRSRKPMAKAVRRPRQHAGAANAPRSIADPPHRRRRRLCPRRHGTVQLCTALAAAAAGCTFPTAMPLVPGSRFEMQQDYVQRLTGLWNDFFTHPERTTAPISDPRFSGTELAEEFARLVLSRTYLLEPRFMTRLAESIEGDRDAQAREVRGGTVGRCGVAARSSSPSTEGAADPARRPAARSLKAGLDNLLKDIGKGNLQ